MVSKQKKDVELNVFKVMYTNFGVETNMEYTSNGSE